MFRESRLGQMNSIFFFHLLNYGVYLSRLFITDKFLVFFIGMFELFQNQFGLKILSRVHAESNLAINYESKLLENRENLWLKE